MNIKGNLDFSERDLLKLKYSAILNYGKIILNVCRNKKIKKSTYI